MNDHPIENLMDTAMNSIKDMIDVDTIIGEPIETSNNVVIIPISKVGFGFAAGGSEFTGETVNEYSKKDKEEQVQYKLPFGGGSGAGVNITPIAFLVVSPDNVRLLPIDHNSCFDRLLDYVPDLFERLNNMFNKHMQEKQDERVHEIRKITSENKDDKSGKIEKEIKKEEKTIKNDEANENKYEESEYEKKQEKGKRENQSYKPKKARFHKPIEDYEFEYDEINTEEEEE